MKNAANKYMVKKIRNMGFYNYYKKVSFEIETNPSWSKNSAFVPRMKIQTPGNDPTGLIFMNDFLYLSDALMGKIFKIDVKRGLAIDEIKAPVDHPWGMCTDGDSIWMTDDVKKVVINVSNNFDKVYKRFYYDKLKGKIDLDLHGLAFYERNLWVSDFMGSRILRIDPSDGRITQEIPVYIPDLSGLLVDGDSFWIASSMLSYLFKVNCKGEILKIVKIMDGDYNHIHALTVINDKEIAFSSRNKLTVTIGEIL